MTPITGSGLELLENPSELLVELLENTTELEVELLENTRELEELNPNDDEHSNLHTSIGSLTLRMESMFCSIVKNIVEPTLLDTVP